MTRKILDLHIHSKYSRACSRDLELPKIAEACAKRGIDIVATGDFTHPKWFEHIKDNLVEDSDGVYKLKNTSFQPSSCKEEGVRFILGTELSCIKKHKEKTRRIHVCVFAPSIEIAGRFNNKLAEMGFNLKADGRPILGLTVKELLDIMLKVDDRMIMIPAHAWTPWFGIFGSKGGYDSLEEAFEELTPHIFAIETGLSSDPAMNWRWSKLDNIALVSNSDAHSCAKLGREANVLEFRSEKDITYKNIFDIIKNTKTEVGQFNYTIEFFPEEGKYHFDGHAACQFSCDPKETKRLGGLCPQCKKPLVIGVMNRVEELSDKENLNKNRVPYKSLVPLPEIIADVLGVGVNSKAVQKQYGDLLNSLGTEFDILLNIPLEKIKNDSSDLLVEAINRVRKGNICVRPGYDGIFGVVKVFEEKKNKNPQQKLILE